jgi:uncharacterized membrane protein HdeD (DUF308 family)
MVACERTDLLRMRWAVGLAGWLALALGVTILTWPGLGLRTLALLFAACSGARGVIALAAARSAPDRAERNWLVALGLFGVAAGAVLVAWGGISTHDFLAVTGAAAITLGIIAFGGAYWLPTQGVDSAMVVLSGLIPIAFGIVIFARPAGGLLADLALLAALALVTGVTEVVVAVGGRGMIAARVSRLRGSTPRR